MSERPQLPPGYTGPVRYVASTGRAAGSVYWAVHCTGGKCVTTGSTRATAVARAWDHWLPSGIPREVWEAMGRAVEFVREFRNSYQYTDIDHFHALDRKAAELLAALGEGVSDGE